MFTLRKWVAGATLAMVLGVMLAACPSFVAASGLEWTAPRVPQAPTGPADPVWQRIPR